VVDLKDVTFIDESGEALLSEMRAAGAEFIASGVETKHLLENLKGVDARSRRRTIGGSPCRSGRAWFDITTEDDVH